MLRKLVGTALLAIALSFAVPSAGVLASHAPAAVHVQASSHLTQGQGEGDGNGGQDENGGQNQQSDEGNGGNQGDGECSGEDAQCNMAQSPASLALPAVGLIVLIGFAWTQRRRLLRRDSTPA